MLAGLFAKLIVVTSGAVAWSGLVFVYAVTAMVQAFSLGRVFSASCAGAGAATPHGFWDPGVGTASSNGSEFPARHVGRGC